MKKYASDQNKFKFNNAETAIKTAEAWFKIYELQYPNHDLGNIIKLIQETREPKEFLHIKKRLKTAYDRTWVEMNERTENCQQEFGRFEYVHPWAINALGVIFAMFFYFETKTKKEAL